MAIVTDPDTLTRASVIFGAKTQEVSAYPIGDTARGDTWPAFANDAYVTNTSNIVRFSGAWTSVADGDVVCLLQGSDAGHYYVNNATSTTDIDLSPIDEGTTTGTTTSTGLTVDDQTCAMPANVTNGSNTLTITAHGYVPGEAVVVDEGGFTLPTGLTDGDVVYIIVDDANTIRLADSYDNALADTGINLTSDGSGGDMTLHKRIAVTVYPNGASTTENISGNPTSGDGTGDIADGVTLQAVYSYGKEEWRDDSIEAGTSNTEYNDDLIKHQFPFEAITSEQFEVGGGAAHDDWNWFNNYSRKKVRTGGWAEKVSATAFDLARETGIITLGSLDTDTQVYYQQTSATTTPVNFTFLGTINEAVRIYYDAAADDSPDNDYTTYLKLFARKKGKTYVQSEIADIGVTTIQTIVNRFPLAHATDTAITSTDGEVLGSSPYRDVTEQIAANTGGDTVTGELTFDDPDGAFLTDEVVTDDTLRITSGSDIGRYTIATVTDANTLVIGSDFEFSGWTGTSSAVDYVIDTPYRTADKTTTPGTADAYATGEMTTSSNVFSDTTEQHFITTSVVANDILHIVKSGVNYGLYKITSVDDANTVTVDDTDQPLITDAAADYRILVAGMYLQYKKTASAAQPSGATSIAFDDDDASYGNRPSITLTGATWNADVVAGTIVEISGSENSGQNDGSYTVYAQETTAIISLVPTDVLILNADDTTASALAYNGFKRDIGGTVYGFNWKVTGNGGGLSDVYQFVQHQLRQTSDIDYGEGTSRGDITDLLMSYAAPTGTTINMYIDDLDSNDINNATVQDHSGVNRTFPFTAAGTLTFNTNLQDDTNAKYWLFFTNDDAGDNLGRDYGTKDAIIVQNADTSPVDIAGTVAAAASVAFTYDFDGNVQRGAASAGVNAPVTLIAIGLETAQFVISTGTITRATGITISAVAALERNYLNT